MKFSLALALVGAATAVSAAEKVIQVGIIGLDTSHAGAFTQIFDDEKSTDHVPGIRVICAYPGGSADIPHSIDRVPGYKSELSEKWKVEMVDSIPALCAKVDAVLLLSVDGRPHLEQAKPVIAAKKPLFIDKPFSASTAQAREIFRLAKEANVPVFGSSALRFAPGIVRAKTAAGAVIGAEAYSPCSLEPHHPDLFWYGVHGVETLYTVMGPGCVSVSRTQTADTDVVVGIWRDGRTGSFRGIRKGAATMGITVFGEKKVETIFDESKGSIYKPLCEEIAKFFRTGVPPVSAEETVELVAFMEAADISKREGGKHVELESVLKK